MLWTGCRIACTRPDLAPPKTVQPWQGSACQPFIGINCEGNLPIDYYQTVKFLATDLILKAGLAAADHYHVVGPLVTSSPPYIAPEQRASRAKLVAGSIVRSNGLLR